MTVTKLSKYKAVNRETGSRNDYNSKQTYVEASSSDSN